MSTGVRVAIGVLLVLLGCGCLGLALWSAGVFDTTKNTAPEDVVPPQLDAVATLRGISKVAPAWYLPANGLRTTAGEVLTGNDPNERVGQWSALVGPPLTLASTVPGTRSDTSAFFSAPGAVWTCAHDPRAWRTVLWALRLPTDPTVVPDPCPLWATTHNVRLDAQRQSGGDWTVHVTTLEAADTVLGTIALAAGTRWLLLGMVRPEGSADDALLFDAATRTLCCTVPASTVPQEVPWNWTVHATVPLSEVVAWNAALAPDSTDWLDTLEWFAARFTAPATYWSAERKTAVLQVRLKVGYVFAYTPDRWWGADTVQVPALPEGIAFDVFTGQLKGQATAVSSWRRYVVQVWTAGNPDTPRELVFYLDVGAADQTPVSDDATTLVDAPLLEAVWVRAQNQNHDTATEDTVVLTNGDVVDSAWRGSFTENVVWEYRLNAQAAWARLPNYTTLGESADPNQHRIRWTVPAAWFSPNAALRVRPLDTDTYADVSVTSANFQVLSQLSWMDDWRLSERQPAVNPQQPLMARLDSAMLTAALTQVAGTWAGRARAIRTAPPTAAMPYERYLLQGLGTDAWTGYGDALLTYQPDGTWTVKPLASYVPVTQGTGTALGDAPPRILVYVEEEARTYAWSVDGTWSTEVNAELPHVLLEYTLSPTEDGWPNPQVWTRMASLGLEPSLQLRWFPPATWTAGAYVKWRARTDNLRATQGAFAELQSLVVGPMKLSAGDQWTVHAWATGWSFEPVTATGSQALLTGDALTFRLAPLWDSPNFDVTVAAAAEYAFEYTSALVPGAVPTDWTSTRLPLARWNPVSETVATVQPWTIPAAPALTATAYTLLLRAVRLEGTGTVELARTAVPVQTRACAWACSVQALVAPTNAAVATPVYAFPTGGAPVWPVELWVITVGDTEAAWQTVANWTLSWATDAGNDLPLFPSPVDRVVHAGHTVNGVTVRRLLWVYPAGPAQYYDVRPVLKHATVPGLRLVHPFRKWSFYTQDALAAFQAVSTVDANGWSVTVDPLLQTAMRATVTREFGTSPNVALLDVTVNATNVVGAGPLRIDVSHHSVLDSTGVFQPQWKLWGFSYHWSQIRCVLPDDQPSTQVQFRVSNPYVSSSAIAVSAPFAVQLQLTAAPESTDTTFSHGLYVKVWGSGWRWFTSRPNLVFEWMPAVPFTGAPVVPPAVRRLRPCITTGSVDANACDDLTQLLDPATGQYRMATSTDRDRLIRCLPWTPFPDYAISHWPNYNGMDGYMWGIDVRYMNQPVALFVRVRVNRCTVPDYERPEDDMLVLDDVIYIH